MLTDEERQRRKERRLKRKQRLAQEGNEIIKPPSIRADCVVCGKPIKPGEPFRKLPPDDKTPEWRYYHSDTCGPGTEAWYEFHPSPTAKLMLASKEVVKEKRLERRMKRLKRRGGGIKSAEVGVQTSTTKPTKSKEDLIMAKAEKTGKGKGEHLKPMQPVIVPASVVKAQSKEVQSLLKSLASMERSSKDAAKIRKSLRKLGFKLSEFREGNGSKKETPPAGKGKGKGKKAAPPEEDDE